MVDLRREFHGIRIGTILIWISFLINPIIHGINMGLVIGAIGCLLIAINTKGLFEYDNIYRKIFAICIVEFILTIISSIVLFIINADPNEFINYEIMEIIPLKSFYVQYSYAILFPLLYGLIAAILIMLLKASAKICKASGAVRDTDVLNQCKKISNVTVIYLITVVATQLLFITEMNAHNLSISTEVNENELIMMTLGYSLSSLIYLVFDIMFFIRMIGASRIMKIMSETALFDSKLYETEQPIDANFVEKDLYSRYEDKY